MSNLISVPRAWVLDYAKLLDSALEYGAAEEARALLAQPAEQHQGEPLSYKPGLYAEAATQFIAAYLETEQWNIYTGPRP